MGEKERRITQAIAETDRTQERAESYREDLRDQALIAFCNSHRQKLMEMLRKLRSGEAIA